MNLNGISLAWNETFFGDILIFMPPFEEEGVYCFANVGR